MLDVCVCFCVICSLVMFFMHLLKKSIKQITNKKQKTNKKIYLCSNKYLCIIFINAYIF